MSEHQSLHIFGGKGGSGKTTLATAFALNLADHAPKEKVLLLSMDPVQALSELLNKKLSTKPTKLMGAPKGDGALFAAELDDNAIAAPFFKDYRAALARSAAKGGLLSSDDVAKLLELHLPGLERLVSLFWVLDALEQKSFDRIVIDGWAANEQLHVLDLPIALKKFLTLLKNAEKGVKGRKAADPYIVDLTARVDKTVAFLRDPSRTSFHLVTLAEPVPEAQTRVLFNRLRERQIPISEVLVNQVEDRGGDCATCAGRRGLQAPSVRKFQLLDKTIPVNLVARREETVRGLDGLKKLGHDIASRKENKAYEFAAAEGPPALVRAPSMAPIPAPPIASTRLIFFTGQGGVGKSSCAAAAAVTLTEKEGPVLLISTDPMHSLSDVLQCRLTDTESQVKGTKGLYARELDETAWFNALRRRWKEKADLGFGKTTESAIDRELLRTLLDAAPAGLEALAGMAVLTDALVQERFKRIVVDVTPTTHTQSLLDVPATAKTWLTSLLDVLVKYRMKGLGDLADDVAAMLKHVKRFEDALASPTEARFMVIARGEELAAARTEAIVEMLKARKLNIDRVVVNRVLPKTGCPKCENRRKNELSAAKHLEKRLSVPVTVAPALGRHPAGLRELKAFRTAWYALSAVAKVQAA